MKQTLRYRIFCALQSGEKSNAELVQITGAKSNRVSCCVCNMVYSKLAERNGYTVRLVPGVKCAPEGRGGSVSVRNRKRESPNPYPDRWTPTELDRVWPSVRVPI